MEKGFMIVSFPFTRNRPGVNMWMPSFLNLWMNDIFLCQKCGQKKCEYIGGAFKNLNHFKP